MAQATTERSRPHAARRSLPDLVVDRIWRFFCSVRMGIYEIAALAVLVLLGTLRGSSVPNKIGELIPAAQPLMDAWYAWDVFHSLPFMALMALTAVAIAIGGIINRAPGIWASIAHPTVATTHGFLRNAEVSASLAAPAPPAELAARLGAALRASRYRVLTEQRGAEVHLYADRFRYAKLGTVPFHLALILILVGGIVGARYGFRERAFTVTEGTARELGHGTGLSVRVDELSEIYRENGSAETYRSDLTLLRDGEPVETASITVNNPLTYDNTVFYQSGTTQAVVLRITDAEGRPVLDDALTLGEWEADGNPDAPAAVEELPVAGAELTVIAPDVNRANAPEKDKLQLWSGQLYLQLEPLGPNSPLPGPVETTVFQGQPATLGGLTVDFVRERRTTVLQVGRNPGIPIFVAASFLLVGGLAVTFYFPHRRVRAIVVAAPDGSRATLAPLARRDWSAQRAFERLLADAERRLDLPIACHAPAATADPLPARREGPEPLPVSAD